MPEILILILAWVAALVAVAAALVARARAADREREADNLEALQRIYERHPNSSTAESVAALERQQRFHPDDYLKDDE